MKHPFSFCVSFAILYLHICPPVNAQFFSAGNEPFNVSWQHIDTEKFKIIYPAGLDHEATRLANYIEGSYRYLQNSMSTTVKQIPIILHHQNVLSNGFVTWAPKRMEIMTTPSRDYSSQDWLENLALHEYRHVLQVYKQNKGFTKVLTFLTGQTGIGLPVAQTPLWLNEGDAVIAETICSKTGRGRMSSFSMPFKACILSHEKSFSYDKLYFGSYKDFVPDYYKLGYYLTSYARIKYGKDIWNKSIDHIGQFSFLPYSLHIGLKNTYGTSRKSIFRETIDTLKSLWSNEYSNLNLTKYSNINSDQSRDYINYRYVHPRHDGSIISFKSSYDELNSIVLTDTDGKETILHVPGYVFENRLSVGSNLIVWDEIVPDPRWEQRNYSVIKSYDLSTGKTKTLTHKSRIFSPCVNHEDQKIAAIEIDLKNTSSLIIMDALNGYEICRHTAPAPGLLHYPVWNGKDSVFAVFTSHKLGKQLYALDLNTGKWSKIFDPAFKNISQISTWKRYLIFTADFSGIDNIYALNINSGELYQITSSRYGAFYPFADERSETLYYSEYTENGYRPVRKKMVKAEWKRFDRTDYFMSDWVNQLTDQEDTFTLNGLQMNKVYSAKRYSRFSNLLNIHSWMPFYMNPQSVADSDLEIKPGLTILSQNILSTSISSVGISYENQTFTVRPSFSYRGFLPVFDFHSTIGGPNKRHVFPADVVPKDTTFPFFEFVLGSYIPFRFSDNKYRKLLQPEIDLEYENTLYYNNGIRKGMLFIHYKLLLYRYLMLARRDIYPEWGQLIRLTFTHTPFESSQYGILTSGSGVFYFPGIMNHHSIFLYGGFQYREMGRGKYHYPVNRITLPRGYSHIMNEPLARMTTKFSLNYGMPLFYPDLSLGSVAYIKRVRTVLFGDYSFAYDRPEPDGNQIQYTSDSYTSIGLDIISDLHLFRFFFPFSLGIRISYVPDNSNVYADFLLSIDTSVF